MAKLTEQIGYIRGLIGSMELAPDSANAKLLAALATRWKISPASWATCATI